MVPAEHLCGAGRHAAGAAIRREIGDLVSRLDLLPWDEAAAQHYGDIRAGLETCGKRLGANDQPKRRWRPPGGSILSMAQRRQGVGGHQTR